MRYAILLIVLTLSAFAQVTRFTEPVKINADGSPIDLKYGYAGPLFTDWDNDGLTDLLVGVFEWGRIKFYKNVGTNASPVLNYKGWLYAGGKILSVPSG